VLLPPPMGPPLKEKELDDLTAHTHTHTHTHTHPASELSTAQETSLHDEASFTNHRKFTILRGRR
jgi:hypothetical protein